MTFSLERFSPSLIPRKVSAEWAAQNIDHLDGDWNRGYVM